MLGSLLELPFGLVKSESMVGAKGKGVLLIVHARPPGVALLPKDDEE